MFEGASTRNNYKRWYDQYPETSQFVGRLLIFPPKIQVALCDEMVWAFEQIFNLQEITASRSLGVGKLTHLWRSKQKRRKYDQIIPVHKTITTITLMPDEEAVMMAERANRAIDSTIEYLSACRDSNMPPLMHEIELICRGYIRGGTGSKVVIPMPQPLIIPEGLTAQSELAAVGIVSSGHHAELDDEGAHVDFDKMVIKPGEV